MSERKTEKNPKGAGRKTDRQRYLDKLAEYDSVILMKMMELAAKGDPAMIKLWHSYRLGNPTTKQDDDVVEKTSIEHKDLLDKLRYDFDDDTNESNEFGFDD